MGAEWLCSIQEAACMLNLSQKIVRRLVAGGVLRSIKVSGTYRVPRNEIELFRERIDDNHSWRDRIEEGLFGLDIEQTERNPAPSGWTDLSDVWHSVPPSEMTYVDLFCGAGGLSLGFEWAGLQGVCGQDFFKEAGQTYCYNFNHGFVGGDIRFDETKAQFYVAIERQLNGRPLDIVAGGFPCQGFSMAGNRIVNDPRNSLYLELLRVVERYSPEWVVCENVKGLRSMLGGRVERKIVSDFAALGYDLSARTLCAADYYTPQKRERVIFIGNRLGRRNLYPRPLISPAHYVTVGQAIGDLVDCPPNARFNHEPTRHRSDMIERMRNLPQGQSLYAGYADAWKRCVWNEPSCTIKENHGGVNVHPTLPRVLTAREMARLQSFPDDFFFCGTKNKQLIQIGNAVPPLLGKAIGLAVRRSAGEV